MKKKYQSEILQVIHDDMKGMHQLGIINDSEMSEFDEMCLAPEKNVSKTAAEPAAPKTKTERAGLVTA